MTKSKTDKNAKKIITSKWKINNIKTDKNDKSTHIIKILI